MGDCIGYLGSKQPIRGSVCYVDKATVGYVLDTETRKDHGRSHSLRRSSVIGLQQVKLLRDWPKHSVGADQLHLCVNRLVDIPGSPVCCVSANHY